MELSARAHHIELNPATFASFAKASCVAASRARHLSPCVICVPLAPSAACPSDDLRWLTFCKRSSRHCVSAMNSSTPVTQRIAQPTPPSGSFPLTTDFINAIGEMLAASIFTSERHRTVDGDAPAPEPTRCGLGQLTVPEPFTARTPTVPLRNPLRDVR